MDDLISRQAAIDMIKTLSDITDVREAWEWTDIFETTINEIPSARPENTTGIWKVVFSEKWCTFDEFKCSECGAVEYFNKGWKKFSYCPNCGAKMEEEHESSAF